MLGHLRETLTCTDEGKWYYVYDLIKIWIEMTKLRVMLLRRSCLYLLAYQTLISLDAYSNLVAKCVRKNNTSILVFTVSYAVINSYIFL
jgi:hypothetical protein